MNYTPEDVKRTIAWRLDWAESNGAEFTGPDGDMVLCKGDLIVQTGKPFAGWTPREVEKTPNLYALRGDTVAQRLAYMVEFWAFEWSGCDANLAEKSREVKVKAQNDADARALRKDWIEYGPPPLYRHAEPESYQPENEKERQALAKVMAFPYAQESDETPQFSTLALLGTPGTGKTLLASIWLRYQVFEAGAGGWFVSAADMAAQVLDKKTRAEALKQFGAVEYLVIDDIGAEDTNVNQHDAVLALIDVIQTRLDKARVTVFTCNGSERQLRDTFGPRGYSRLMAQAQVIVSTGRDRRLTRPDMQERSDREVRQ